MKTNLLMKHILVLFSILLTSSTFGHTSYNKKIVCPIDGHSFTIRVTGSYTTFGSFKDFQKQGAIGDLYESYVNACPKCHYSGYQSDFDTTFSNTVKEEITELLKPFKDAEMTDVVENEIAVKIHQYFKDDNDGIANLYLVASYFLRRDSSQTAKRKALQENCLQYLIKAIENKEYKDKGSYATIYYLIGELYRRTGQFDLAITYYDLAINDKHKKDWLEEIAKEQKELAIKKDDNNDI